MIKFNPIVRGAALLSAALFSFSCSDDDAPAIVEETSMQKYFVAARVGDGTYLLTADDLESGAISTAGNGLELPRAYNTWVTNGNLAAVGLIYAQGDPGVGVSYGIDKFGELKPVGNEFQITSRFTTNGAFDNYVVTAVSGQTLTNGKIGSVFNFIDLENNNNMSQKTIVTENFTGNGDMATFSGIVEFGNGEFLTGVVASGLKDAEGGGGSSTGVVTYPDSVWVAAFDKDLNLKRIYRDNRISYASGRYRSQYYSQITKDGQGDVYVFSGAFDSNTTKPAGALRIKKGAAEFDPSYHFNIQEKSGGYRFKRVWHVSEDYFLLELYNELEYTSLTPATQYAIVKMGNNSFTWLTNGFPTKDEITATGIPYADGGKMFFPVTKASGQPTVYVIDPKSTSAKAGLTVEADGIAAIAKLTSQE